MASPVIKLGAGSVHGRSMTSASGAVSAVAAMS